jgi:hypothetical protein
MEVTALGAGVFTIRNFLNTEECQRYIALSEQIGFSEAAVATDDGDRVLKDARNNDRILLDQPELADELFAKARPHLPPAIDGWRLCGFNERMRFEGGATQFRWETVQPQAGMALVFPHRLSHQGTTVTRGTKYVLRTDVMYANSGR